MTDIPPLCGDPFHRHSGDCAGWASRNRIRAHVAALTATIDALTRERDEAVEKVARLQLHVEMHEERTDAAEQRATQAEGALRDCVEWMERKHGGDESLDSEDYYIARDGAKVVLATYDQEDRK